MSQMDILRTATLHRVRDGLLEEMIAQLQARQEICETLVANHGIPESSVVIC